MIFRIFGIYEKILKPTLRTLYLLINALVLVIKSVVMTFAGQRAEKISHLIFIEGERAGIGVRVFVILIEFTAITACFMLYSVLREVHISESALLL